jgi:hypothetical protein
LLVAICVGMLAAPALASAGDPVTGALDALGATAVRQVAAVTPDTTSAPLATSTDVPPVVDDVSQTVAAVPQVADEATTTVRATADSAAERTRPLGPPEDKAPSGPDQRAPASPSHPMLATVAGQTGHVIAGATRVPAVGGRAPLHVIQSSSATGVSHAARRLARTLVHVGTLVDTVTSAPATHELSERASRLTGALLGGVGIVAKTANAALATVPLSGLASLLQPLTNSTTPEPIPGASGRSPQTGASATPSAASGSASTPTPAVPLASAVIGASPFDRLGSTPGLQRLPATERGAKRTLAISRVATNSGAADEMHARARAPSANAAASTPAPGGISAASGAGASGGLTAIPSFTLVALLLLLLVPPVLRRLRLSGESLRAAQFALIPERPG